MTTLKERLRIHDICRAFEWDHFPKVLIVVEPGFTKGRWIVHMGATGFSSDGTFSKEVSREVIFGRNGLKDRVLEVLDSMYCELYD